MAKGRKTGGRQKGTPNRITAERKEFLRAFVDGNRAEAERKWAEIDDPADAFRLYLAAAEFVHPKLGRTEVTGEGGGPVEFVVRDLANE